MKKYTQTIMWIALFICVLLSTKAKSQIDTIVLGFGGRQGVMMTASSSQMPGDEDNTMNHSGFLPNENGASRFLSQATLGYNYNDIISVSQTGQEDWIDSQFNTARSFILLDKVYEYRQVYRDSLNNQAANTSSRMWDYAWWQYLMTSPDALRQRVAFALSEIIVVSENSAFGNSAMALADYYDILLNNSFGNYRDLLQEVTYSPVMGVYLTYLNNPKTDVTKNQFPDENYARELMQLFTIGTTVLNEFGEVVLDGEGLPMPTYDNEDIFEFSKIFTGLTWHDRTQFGRSAYNDTSYTENMVMWETYHEPGVKNLLNGFQVPDRNPIDGNADITDALDHLFNHPNLPPFICKLLIQRLVTSNPENEYVKRVVDVFKNNGQGVRGDLKAVIKAILLDPIARDCDSGSDANFGMLREPFIRYVQINKGFNAFTSSGNYRNDMDYVYQYVSQKPLASPSVFNFFHSDYQPIGLIEDEGKVAPEFEITDAQSIAGYVNGLYRWVIENNPADEYDLFSGEDNNGYADEISSLDLSEEVMFTDYDQLHILLDRLNLVVGQGRVSQKSIDIITNALKEFPNSTPQEREVLVRIGIYLLMTSPEYLINR